MLFFLRRKVNSDIRNKIASAFPENMRSDVYYVLKLIGKSLFYTDRTGYNLRMTVHEFTLFNDEHVYIPYRIWIDECKNIKELTPVQQTIMDCIYTRSINGYVREKHIKAILEGDMPFWVYPFILKLSDEYVIEIIETIYQKLKDKENNEIKDFCLRNLSYFLSSHARMISYWDCFYRDRCYRYKDYIGRKLYHECFGYSRKLEKIAVRKVPSKTRI